MEAVQPSDWAVTDPDFELRERGGGGGRLFCFASFCDFFFFLPKIRGARPPGPFP